MILIDVKSRQPIYEQLYNGIVRLSALGAMLPGETASLRAIAGAGAGRKPQHGAESVSAAGTGWVDRFRAGEGALSWRTRAAS